MKSIRHSRSFEIDRPIEMVFPMFTPEGEKLWVPGWDYENVMESNKLAEDYVFLTKSHDHARKDAIWIVKRYDPQLHIVQFYKVEPEEKIDIVTVKCTEAEPDRTRVTVIYKYMALSSTGERFVSEFSESAYERYISEWHELLSGYFEASR